MDVTLRDGMEVLKDLMLVIKEFQEASFVSDIEQILEFSVVVENQFEDEQKRAIQRLLTIHKRTKQAQTQALLLASTTHGIVDYTKRSFQRDNAEKVSIPFAKRVQREIVPGIKKMKDKIEVAINLYSDISEDISCLLSWCDSKTDNMLASNPEAVSTAPTSASIGLLAAELGDCLLTRVLGSALALGPVAGAAVTIVAENNLKKRRLLDYEEYQQTFKEHLRILQGHRTESNILSKILECIELAEERLCSGNARLSNKITRPGKDLNNTMKQTCDQWKEIDRLCMEA